MRKEGLKKDGAKNGIAEDQDVDATMGNGGEENLDSSNGGDVPDVDPLDVSAEETSNKDTASVASEKRSSNKTKGAKKAIVDVPPEATSNGTSEGDEDGSYEVEDIVDHKIERKKLLFLVRWKNFSSSDDTWEPEASLSCSEIIAAYREAHPDAVLAAKPKKAASSAKTNGTTEEEYEVEDIVDHKIQRKKNVFLIRWKGYEAEQDTWEKEESLTCPEIVKKYKKAHAGKLAEDIKSKPKKTPEEKAEQKKARAEKQYEVQRIIGSKTNKGKIMYQVRWKNYPASQATWEYEESLSCPEKITEFLETEKKKRPPTKRESAKKKIYGEVPSDADEESEDEKIPAKKQRGNAAAKTEAAEEDYEVERIVDDKLEKNKKFYLVKWRGWPSSSNTWQSKESLSCPELLKKYEDGKSAANKTPKKSPAKTSVKTTKTPVKAATATPKRKSTAAAETPVAKKPKSKVSKKPTPAKASGKKGAKATKASSSRRQKVADEEKEQVEETATEESWEVEGINDVKYNDDGSKEFLIRWKGCDPSQDTWEPESNLDCHLLIKKFLNSTGSSSDAKPSKKKSRK